MEILFFATLKDRAGTDRAVVELGESTTVRDLKALVAQRFPSVAPLLKHTLVAVNQTYAFDDDPVREGDEVALFPPVSGGSDTPTILKIETGPLDLDALVQGITLPTTGAACVFCGMVRAETQRGSPHHTTSLEYEAYAPMAEKKMAQVAEEIRVRWPSVEGIAIVQRVGRLGAGTPTVAIACTAAHRDTGVFEAARYGIDRLKEIVPVWKKEIGPAGEVWIEGDYQPRQGD